MSILVLPIVGLTVPGLTLLVIPALATALFGGFRSFPLILVGGLTIGIAESLMTRYVSQPGWAQALPFLIIVAVLVVRGDVLPTRGAATFSLPRAGSGRIPVWAPFAIVVIGGFIVARSDQSQAQVLAQTFAVALIMLSLVVVIGYAGQASLAQYALAGLGAFFAGRSAQLFGVPFPVAFVIGVLCSIVAGVVMSLPALRTRGITLAISTLGLALGVEKLVLGNPDLIGGFNGTIVDRPTLFGWEIDTLFHPHRYATVALVLMVAGIVLVGNLRRGAAGRRLLAVRSNEGAAAALGISTVRAKVYAFGVGAALASAGGVLMAFQATNVQYAPFSVQASINAVVLTTLNGIGFIASGVTASLASPGNIVGYLLADLGVEQYFLLASGILLIVVLVKSPDGALSRPIDLFRRLRPARSDDGGMSTGVPAIEPVHPHVLSASGVSVRFGGVAALDDVGIEVVPGQITGLIGPNGAGKTTLVDVLSGFTRPDAGRIVLDGHDITMLSPRQRALRGMGRSFQGLQLFEDMTVLENLRVACEGRDWQSYFTHLVRPRCPELSGAAKAAVAVFGLEHDLGRLPTELPFGRRRLVAIARAVAARPAVLLLDEPAAGLDESQRVELGMLIRRLAEEWGIAVLLIEHDVPMVIAICDRIVALDFGRVVATGDPATVLRTPAVVSSYLGLDPDAPVEDRSRVDVDDAQMTEPESELAT